MSALDLNDNSLDWLNSDAMMPSVTGSDIDLSGSAFGGGSSGSGLSGLSMGMSLIGGIGKAYGQYMKGKQTQKADQYNADLVYEQGLIEEYQLDRAEVATLASARAMTAKAGVTQSGSPLDAALASASGFELDKQIANYNTQSRINMLNWEGKQAEHQGKVNAGLQLAETALPMVLALL